MEDIYSIILAKLDLEDFLNLRSVNRCAYLASFHTDFILHIELFIDMCRWNSITEIEYVYSLFKIEYNKLKDFNEILNIIIDFCEQNNLNEAKWFYNKFNMTCMDDDIFNYVDISIVFEHVCENGSLETAKWIHESLYHFEEIDFDLLGSICFINDPFVDSQTQSNNIIEIGNWLLNNFKFANDEDAIRKLYNETFHNLIINNPKRNLMVIEWYYKVLSDQINYNNIINIINLSLWEKDIENKIEHIAIIKWLHSLIVPIKSKDMEKIITNACINGKLDIAKFFYDLNTNFKFDYEGVFNCVCEEGILDVAQWLHSTFNITEEYFKSKNSRAFLLALFNGHIETAEWLFETFNKSKPIDIMGFKITK